jgi:hypothetical protein
MNMALNNVMNIHQLLRGRVTVDSELVAADWSEHVHGTAA